MAFFMAVQQLVTAASLGLLLLFVYFICQDHNGRYLLRSSRLLLYMYRPQKGGHAVKMQIKQTPKCQTMDKLLRGIKPECSSMICIHINFHFS